MKKLVASLLLGASLVLASFGTVLAVGGPNEAGNSGKFHPQSDPCQAEPNHPHCPGPH